MCLNPQHPSTELHRGHLPFRGAMPPCRGGGLAIYSEPCIHCCHNIFLTIRVICPHPELYCTLITTTIIYVILHFGLLKPWKVRWQLCYGLVTLKKIYIYKSYPHPTLTWRDQYWNIYELYKFHLKVDKIFVFVFKVYNCSEGPILFLNMFSEPILRRWEELQTV